MDMRLDPGPIDPSVLSLQEQHRSQDIWSGQDLGLLKCRQHLRKWESWRLDDRVLDYVKRAGFYGVHRASFQPVDRGLITALVERWRQETHSFHLAVGEATITLQDVAVLLGLRVHGHAVTGKSDYIWAELAVQWLGVKPPESALSASSLSITYLREQFAHLPADANDATVQCFARAYLLTLMGDVLFADKSGNSVQLIYLPLLSDLDRVHEYSWGSATLAFLYRHLCRASQRGTTDIGGALILLQWWSWERIHIGRPIIGALRIQPPKDGPADPQPSRLLGNQHQYGIDPLGCRWLRVTLSRSDGSGLGYYRDALNHQRDDQITWEPYTEEVLQSLPDVCRDHHLEWRVIAPLICFDIIEWHFPDRVMRQFGFQQPIPLSCVTDTALHRVDKRGKAKEDWSKKHEQYVNHWDRRLERVVKGDRVFGPMQHSDPYMVWYRQITRLFITPPTQRPSTDYQHKVQLLSQCLVSAHDKLDQIGPLCPLEARSVIDEVLTSFSVCLETVGQPQLLRPKTSQSLPPPPPSQTSPPLPPQLTFSPPPPPAEVEQNENHLKTKRRRRRA